MVASDSVMLRKLALEFASLQLTNQPHMGVLYKVAMHLVKAGKCLCHKGCLSCLGSTF